MWITEICNCLQNMSSVHHDATSPLLSPILPGLLRASWVPPSIPVHLHPIAQNPDIDSYKYARLTSNKGAKQSNGGKIAFSVNGVGQEHIHACRGQTQVPMTAGLRPLAGPSSCPSPHTTQRGVRQTGKRSPSFSWKPVCIFFSWGSSVSADSEAGVALSIAKCSSLCLRHLLLLSPGAHLQRSAIFLLPPGAPWIWHGFKPHMKTETPSLRPGFFPIPSVCFTTSLPRSSSHFSRHLHRPRSPPPQPSASHPCPRSPTGEPRQCHLFLINSVPIHWIPPGIWSCFSFFSLFRHPVTLAPCVQKILLFSISCFDTFMRNQLIM